MEMYWNEFPGDDGTQEGSAELGRKFIYLICQHVYLPMHRRVPRRSGDRGKQTLSIVNKLLMGGLGPEFNPY
jgi:hypothetical protein